MTCEARGACHFFLKFFWSAHANARLVLYVRMVLGPTYVCYNGRSTTDDVGIIGKTVLDPSGICYFVFE